MKIIAIDNGATGWYALMEKTSSKDTVLWEFKPMPTKTTDNYTKKKQVITRIDVLPTIELLTRERPALIVTERPMIMPARFKQSLSAARAFEALTISSEAAKVPLLVMDSKEWQRVMIPTIRDYKNLKRESLKKASELYPSFIPDSAKDGDAVCMGYFFLERIARIM